MIVDTDILIDFLRDRGEVAEKLENYKSERSIETTDINVFELYQGAYKSNNATKNASRLKGLLNRIKVHSTTEDSMEIAGKIAAELETEGEKIGAKDVLISGIALIENKPVLSRNQKHFGKIDDLEVLSLENGN